MAAVIGLGEQELALGHAVAVIVEVKGSKLLRRKDSKRDAVPVRRVTAVLVAFPTAAQSISVVGFQDAIGRCIAAGPGGWSRDPPGPSQVAALQYSPAPSQSRSWLAWFPHSS